MQRHAWIAGVILLLWLGGCAASSPPAQRYTLPVGQADSTRPPADPERRLLVRTPRLAHYLNVDGIVLQLDDITLNEARNHLWAEPLPRQLERALRTRLAVRLPDTRILRSDDGPSGPTLSLHLAVDRFQGHHDGTALAAGQWQLRDADGQLLLADDFEAATELQGDGYPALVRALGESWDRVADRISESIRDRL